MEILLERTKVTDNSIESSNGGSNGSAVVNKPVNVLFRNRERPVFRVNIGTFC